MLTVSRASVDATRVMMKQMGFNLLITPAAANPARYQALDFQDAHMPEDYVARLADSSVLAQHFVGKYQQTIQVDGRTIVLTGVLAERSRGQTAKKPMPRSFSVRPGEILVGSAAAQALSVMPGDTLTLLGTTFTVADVLDEVGAIPEDIRVFAHLNDVQVLLDRPGQINAIDALSCQCPVDAEDLVSALRESILEVLPDVRIQPYHSILLARHNQRAMIARLQWAALTIVLLVGATSIWGLTQQNVQYRRHEIGVLRALGVPDSRIITLFLAKILAYSIPGSVVGSVAGYFVVSYMQSVSGTAPVPTSTIIAVIALTPLATVVFALPPIMGGLTREVTSVIQEGNT
jgi:ABC-type lipoprotein release transport system permease subunit